MKHLIFLTAITVLLSIGTARAQHVNIGIKGGLNAYTLLGDNNSAYDPKLSFHVGLLGHIHLSSRFAFQPEAVLSAQGTSYKIADDTNSHKLNYLNFPLLLQYMYDNGFRIEAGPQLGILLSAKLVTPQLDTNLKPNYENTDIGAVVGLSYVKPSTGFGMYIRYNHGLSNINSSDASKSYNRGVQAGLFLLLQHKS
jgi:hypothetical protein